MSSKKVSLLTAEDIGVTVETTGYIRTRRMTLHSFEVDYSDEVRLSGRLDSFRPVPVTPNAQVLPNRGPIPKGYELQIGGVNLHVPAKFVVTFGAIS